MLENLIATAHAAEEATAGAAPQGVGIGELLILAAFVLIFYFMLWRPQSKRAKEHRQLLESLAKGDEIVTAGGILGKIVKMQDDLVIIAISENVEIKVQKASVVAVLPKGTIKSTD